MAIRPLAALALAALIAPTAAAQVKVHIGVGGYAGSHDGYGHRHDDGAHRYGDRSGTKHFKPHYKPRYRHRFERNHIPPHRYRYRRHTPHSYQYHAYSFQYQAHPGWYDAYSRHRPRDLRGYATIRHYRPFYRRHGYIPFVYSPPEDADANTIRERPSAHSGAYRRAWRALEGGRDARALDRFAELAPEHQHDGGPKIGYALASAAIGAHDKAAWAMRRALRYDPGAFAEVPIGRTMQTRLRDLLDHYQDALMYEQDADAWLMLQATRLLAGEHEPARDAIENAPPPYADEANHLRAALLALDPDRRRARDMYPGR